MRAKKLQPEDLLIIAAYVFFMVLTILYIVVAGPLFRITKVGIGKAPQYPEMMEDYRFMLKLFFCNTMFLWLTLWCVKFSLLALYRKLMSGLQAYVRLWWAVSIFCAVVGAVRQSKIQIV